MDNGNEMAAVELPPVREAEFQELNAEKSEELLTMPNVSEWVRQINSNGQLLYVQRGCPCGSDIIQSGNGKNVWEEGAGKLCGRFILRE